MKNKKAIKYFIIDFDSTFVQSEGLEELASVALFDRPDREAISKKIKDITNMGMEGKIPFEESLKRRLKLLKGNRLHIEQVVRILKKKVSPSILRNRDFFRKFKDRVYIISGGFNEFILPIIKPFGISETHVLANKFMLDKQGKIIGLDSKNPLSTDGGKVKVVRDLKLDGEIIVIGDGYTDYQIKEMGAAKHFIAFTENVKREIVLKKADHIAPNFDEFLYINKLPRSLSYPKNRIKVYYHLDHDRSIDGIFKKEGYVDGRLEEAHIVIVTTKIKATDFFLKKAVRLMVIALLNTQSNIINLNKFSERGIVVLQDGSERIAKKIISYINTGNTVGSVNIPYVRLKKKKDTHRLLHIHKNVPGILARINGIMAKYNINILSQYLKTNAKIGYVITDVNKKYNKKVLSELKKISDTIRFRILY